MNDNDLQTLDNRLDCLAQGKTTLPLNIKNPKAQTILRKLVMKSDVIIEPYRPGVMEKLGLFSFCFCEELV